MREGNRCAFHRDRALERDDLIITFEVEHHVLHRFRVGNRDCDITRNICGIRSRTHVHYAWRRGVGDTTLLNTETPHEFLFKESLERINNAGGDLCRERTSLAPCRNRSEDEQISRNRTRSRNRSA